MPVGLRRGSLEGGRDRKPPKVPKVQVPLVFMVQENIAHETPALVSQSQEETKWTSVDPMFGAA